MRRRALTSVVFANSCVEWSGRVINGIILIVKRFVSHKTFVYFPPLASKTFLSIASLGSCQDRLHTTKNYINDISLFPEALQLFHDGCPPDNLHHLHPVPR